MFSVTVLAVGAHPDDVELGCGGTLWRHRRAGARVVIAAMTDGLMGPGHVELRRAEARAAADELDSELRLLGLPDGSLSASAQTVQPIEAIINEINPDIIYTHAEDDSHQDHRATASAVLSAGRNSQTILHFQSPSTRRFHPQLFVGLETVDLERKIAALDAHASQVANSSRVDIEAVQAAARYWGTQARTFMAEPFEITRALFGFSPDRPKVHWSPEGVAPE
ncbi:MAG: PIG-L deacetylase family protein [Candidatus Nanopelagicales bacterium]